jgi:hypothetical protein
VAGLIGIFALCHQPLAPTTAAVLVYYAIALWIPALPGSVAFVQLRRRLGVKPTPPRSGCRWSSRDHSADQLVAEPQRLQSGRRRAERFQAM